MRAQFQSHSGSATQAKTGGGNVLSFITAHERARLLHKHNLAYLKYLGVPSYPKDATPEELAEFIDSEDTKYVIQVCLQRKLKQIFGGCNEANATRH